MKQLVCAYEVMSNVSRTHSVVVANILIVRDNHIKSRLSPDAIPLAYRPASALLRLNVRFDGNNHKIVNSLILLHFKCSFKLLICDSNSKILVIYIETISTIYITKERVLLQVIYSHNLSMFQYTKPPLYGLWICIVSTLYLLNIIFIYFFNIYIWFLYYYILIIQSMFDSLEATEQTETHLIRSLC